MEKTDHKPADKFIDALIKSLQSLCHGYLDFQKGVEIIGYINLSVDKENSVDCVLKERVCKTAENATSFISNSFHAKPEEASTENGQSGSQAAASKKSRERSATSSDADLPHSHHGNVKRKASQDQNNDTYSKKSSSHPSKVRRLSSENSHPPGPSSSVDSKADLQKMIASGADASETEHSQSSSRQSKSPVDSEQVKLTGIVLEPVDDQNYGGEDEGDFDVTFIKEEYFEDESSACEYQSPGGQPLPADQYRTGQNPNSSYSTVSSQSSTSTTSSFKVEPSEHLDLSGNSSFQPHPGPSGIRGEDWSQQNPDSPGDNQEGQSSEENSQSPQKKLSAKELASQMPDLSDVHPKTKPVPLSMVPSSSPQIVMPSMSGMLPEHQGMMRSRILLCEYCDASFTSPAGLYLHKASVHFKRKFVCSICDKKFTRKETLTNHMYSHSSPSPNSLKCPFCPVYFRPSLLPGHIAAKHADSPEPKQ